MNLILKINPIPSKLIYKCKFLFINLWYHSFNFFIFSYICKIITSCTYLWKICLIKNFLGNNLSKENKYNYQVDKFILIIYLRSYSTISYINDLQIPLLLHKTRIAILLDYIGHTTISYIMSFFFFSNRLIKPILTHPTHFLLGEEKGVNTGKIKGRIYWLGYDLWLVSAISIIPTKMTKWVDQNLALRRK